MPKYAAATIVSKRNIASARVIAESFLEHNQEISFFVLLTDEPEGCFDPAAEQYTILKLAEIPAGSDVAFRFQYDEMELSYATTPAFLLHLLDRGFDGVLFLKQETLVLDSLDPIFAKLEQHSVVLTPHFLQPPAIPNAFHQELSVLRAGVFNGGVLAFANTEEARTLLTWWERKVQRNCYRDVDDGFHFEQRWLDFFPALAPNAHILRDPGVNVGHWNVLDRQLAETNGRLTAAGVPCRIFRFSGCQPEAPHMVTRYNAELTVESTGPAAAIFRLYHERLQAAGYAEAQRWPYAFSNYDNGVPIPPDARRAFHDFEGNVRRFGDPFATAGPDSFYNWYARRKK